MTPGLLAHVGHHNQGQEKKNKLNFLWPKMARLSATKMMGRSGHWSEPGEYKIVRQPVDPVVGDPVRQDMNIGKFCPLPLCTLIGNFRRTFCILFLLSLSCRTGSVTTGSTGSQIVFLGSILVMSSQDSFALGKREFAQEGAMTISPFAAREGTSAPQWPNVKKCCRHLVPSSDFFVQSYAVPSLGPPS